MTEPRVVRDRTQHYLRSFEIIQAREISLFVTFERSAPPSSPRDAWRVTFTAQAQKDGRAQRLFGHGETAEEAFRYAALRLTKATPLGSLPSFTSAEWATLTEELRAQGAFDASGERG
ncbi:MAG TPA: hypothetical protein VGI39_13735 [Polyangiaceae bacterium]|jgi:hypothetical protein